MSKLRELIEGQPRLINPMVARAFISELKEVDIKGWNILTAYCDSAIEDVDLLTIALGPVLHYEERAKAALNAIDDSIVIEVKGYIKDKMADFDEEDEAEIMDDEDLRTQLNSLMGWDPR